MARTWDEYHREVAGVAAQMVGAADYLAEHPEFATDERLAAAFREYVARLRAVQTP